MEAKFKVKFQTILEIGISRDLYSDHMTIEVEFIMVVQKNQVKKLVLIDIKNNTKK